LKIKFKNKKNICKIDKGTCDKNIALPLNVNITSNVSTFSEIKKNVNNIDLLKIDVEAFEFKALKGTKDILKKKCIF